MEIIAVAALKVAVVGEAVTVHDCLDGIVAISNIERELTLEVGLQRLAAFHDLSSVQQEASTLDGYRRAVVHDVA